MQALTQARTPQSPSTEGKAAHQGCNVRRGGAPARNNGRPGSCRSSGAAGDRSPLCACARRPLRLRITSPSRVLGYARLLPARLLPSLPGFPGDGRKWREETAHEARRKRLPRATSGRLLQTALVGDREAPEVVLGGRSHGDAAATRR